MRVHEGVYLILVVAAALLLSGCGKRQTGGAQLSICWPAGASAVVPSRVADLSGMHSITMTVYRKKKVVATRTLNRPLDNDASPVKFAGVPVNNYRYLATAYAGKDGQGETLGTASGLVEIAQDHTTQLTLTTVVDPHAILSISPESRTIYGGDHLSFSAQLVNPNGDADFLPAHSLHWSSDDPKVVSVDAATGAATGRQPGTTCIHLHVEGSTLTASITITVAEKPATVLIFTDKQTVTPGARVTLIWQAHNADRVVRSVGFDTNQLSGSIIVAPMTTTTYAITVAGPGGQAESETIVVVQTIPGKS